MAVIGKIQKNSLLLLIVIGVAMLAFIFTDFIKNSGDEIERLDMGTVYDEPINEDEYLELAEIFENRERQNFQFQNKEFTDADKRYAEDQAFNEVVRRVIMNTEFDKLGIETTVTELNDMIHGNHVHPWVMQIPNFNGAQGFSRDSVRKFINSLEIEPQDPAARENWILMRQQWKDFENELKSTRAADKYVTLVKKGLYVNELEAKDFYTGVNEKKQVKFVLQRYSDIPADEIEITDEEIEAYYNEHKEEPEFEQEEARDIDFIQFNIEPTEADKQEIMTQINELKSSFETTPNNIGFMANNSDLPDAANTATFLNDSMEFRYGSNSLFIYADMFGNMTYPADADDAIQAADSGDVIGPFLSSDQYIIAKVTGIKKEKQAWVRHILVKTDVNRTADQAKAKADSIINVIKENDNFVEMVTAHSDDPGSIATNGEYKWFPEGRMVPEFNDASFNGKIGELQLVKTTYGYHIVEVLGQGERTVPQLALVGKKVEPSEETIDFQEELLFDFIYEIQKSEKDSAFYRAAEDSGQAIMSTRLFLNSMAVNGFKKPETALGFAFDRNVQEGDISNPLLDGGKYTVAVLSNIIEEGTPDFRDVKDRMRFPALQDKQAKAYMEKMQGKSSLEEVASVITNGVVMSADVTFANTAIQGGGANEAKVIGQLFTNIPEGSLTKPIQGVAGVYVFQIEGTTEAPETSDFTVIRKDMYLQRQNAADNGVIKALRENADVIDNRRKRQFM